MYIYIYVYIYIHTYLYANSRGWAEEGGYRGTLLMRNTRPAGPYSSPTPRDLWGSYFCFFDEPPCPSP